ncbi:hypothetical protein Tco_1032554 [Tanacetum coccineum]|uniref:1-phosphatidylinositol 4-kinase n=1 Tax=Tanacetum coccineum TaxID=301880 RepID=A0ABQ5GDW4_9ASTR
MAVALFRSPLRWEYHGNNRIGGAKAVGRRRVFVQTELGYLLGMNIDRSDNAHMVKRRLQIALNFLIEESSLTFGDMVLNNDLSVVHEVVIAMKLGVDPILVIGGLGGAYYFIRMLNNDDVGRFSEVELILIDHGLCLPKNLEDSYFEWIHWPQASILFLEDELEYKLRWLYQTMDTDKSSSRTIVQDLTQPKATTDKKKKKKQNPDSYQAKYSKVVKKTYSKKPVAETQLAKVFVEISDSTHSLEASISTKEVEHLPEADAIEKVTILNLGAMQATTLKTSLGESSEDPCHPRPNRESLSTFNFSKFSVHPKSAPRNNAHGFLTHDADLVNYRLCKDLQYHAHKSQTVRAVFLGQRANDVDIRSPSSLSIDIDMEDVLSDQESVPNDESTSMSNGDDYSDKVLSPQDEVVADKIIDEVVELNNTSSVEVMKKQKKDISVSTGHVSAASISKVPSISDPQPIHIPKMIDVQEHAAKHIKFELAARDLSKLKHGSRDKHPSVHALATMKQLSLHTSLTSAQAFKSVLPRMIIDSLEEKLPEILYDTIRLKFLPILTESLKNFMPKVSMKIIRALNSEIPGILKQTEKTVNKQFHALNNLEAERFCQLEIFMKNVVTGNISDKLADIAERLYLTNIHTRTMLKEVFKNGDPLVDGIERNLSPP